MVELVSEFKKIKKLRDCANYDRDHISENYAPVGDWVVLIKKALNVWVGKQSKVKREKENLHILPESMVFDKQTGDLVEKYKRALKIFNRAKKIDRIVGVNTVYFLDREFPTVPDPDPYHPPGVIFPPHKWEEEDNPNLIRAGNRFAFKMLNGISGGEIAGGFSYKIAIWDIDNDRSAVYEYSGTIFPTIGIPISESGEGNWILKRTPVYIQVDQFSGRGTHESLSLLVSAMKLTFVNEHLSNGLGSMPFTVPIPPGPTKSVGVESGDGRVSLIPGSVKVFKDPKEKDLLLKGLD